MATLNATIKVTSADITKDSLSLSNLKSYTVNTGGILTKNITATTEGAAVKVFESTEHDAGTKIFLHNKNATRTLKIKLTASTTHEMTLAPGAWAFFPWRAAVDITVFASAAGGTILEYGAFAQV